VFDTAVEASVAIIACPIVAPGNDDLTTNQYVTRFQIAAADRLHSSIHVISPISDRTAEKSATFGNTPTKIATITANENTPPISRRWRRKTATNPPTADTGWMFAVVSDVVVVVVVVIVASLGSGLGALTDRSIIRPEREIDKDTAHSDPDITDGPGSNSTSADIDDSSDEPGGVRPRSGTGAGTRGRGPPR
jgi:hypothetical protein